MNATHTPPLSSAALAPALDAAPCRPIVGKDVAPGLRRRWNSQTLLGQDREIEIEHAGQLYRLRVTSLGKLILTK
ncbi:hemin uptake protein HemP [Pelomonas sp. CA6]|uniref:hemin uptake protein HemP n=1 Tax=Pelomonas sp. CA6 TaxID=2907999 RepID=UPI001F4C02C6|nr:hemin uptake protein HemP [Pelomonas sp. CA6]MCH7343677.1 hemin uptake protein HemP [Pelomonas sp. CA6]